MVRATIDGKAIEVADGTTILEAALAEGIDIPTLCFFKDLNDIGSCRMCVVEVEGEERLEASCNTAVSDGMNILTNSSRVKSSRLETLKLLLKQHDLNCAYCKRNGTCRFQKLLLDEKLIEWDPSGEFMMEAPSPYGRTLLKGKRAKWPEENIVQRDANRCIHCGRCVSACKKLEGIGVWGFLSAGVRSYIGVASGNGGADMRSAGCVSCGQCITHCPTGALTERDDTQALLDAIADPSKTTVVQIAPATRTSWGVGLGYEDGELSVNRMVAVLKEMGVDYVFDTSFSADLTIMEEGTELLHGLNNAEKQSRDENNIKWPMFTSCCPGWVRHAMNCHPDVVPHLSTAKSPMMMLGAVVKTWFAKEHNLQPEDIFSVALMPCTAKKHEIKQPINSHDDVVDMDASLTTREFIRMVKNSEIDMNSLTDVPLDDPMGEYSGAGVIFGTTGGVMEAALRTAYCITTGEKPSPDAFEFAPSNVGNWKEATFSMKDADVRCAVAHGLVNADALLEAIRSGKVEYDFVEIMACPSGCAGGGGQPIDGTDRELGMERGATLRSIDKNVTPLRFSHENPQIKMIYDKFLEEPCSEIAHKLLHREYN